MRKRPPGNTVRRRGHPPHSSTCSVTSVTSHLRSRGSNGRIAPLLSCSTPHCTHPLSAPSLAQPPPPREPRRPPPPRGKQDRPRLAPSRARAPRPPQLLERLQQRAHL